MNLSLIFLMWLIIQPNEFIAIYVFDSDSLCAAANWIGMLYQTARDLWYVNSCCVAFVLAIDPAILKRRPAYLLASTFFFLKLN